MKLFRAINKSLVSIKQLLRKSWLNLQYPGLKIDKKSKLGNNCKIVCTKGSSLKITNCNIDNGVKLIAAHGALISIKDSYIGSNSVIVARKEIIIGSNCKIAEMVVIRDQNHNYGSMNKTIKEQGFTSSPILIEENVWIGAKATILKGVTIKKNAVIGAHSLVNKDIECNSVNIGVPAKQVKAFK